MYIKVNQERFIKEFENHGKQNTFSYEGLIALYNLLTSLESENMQEGMLEIELDVMDICCAYTEYKDKKSLFYDYPELESIDEKEWYAHVMTIIYLRNGGYIIGDY